MKYAPKFLWPVLLSLIAFSALATPPDSSYTIPLPMARLVALDLLRLDSLRLERPLLVQRIERLERLQMQQANRLEAQRNELATREAIEENMDRQLVAQQSISQHYQVQAATFKRQRNVAIAIGTVATAVLVTTLVRRSSHPP